ncbi:hypothetical protein LINGRAHAP2_LOCUS23381, partial [Linum grandiflorum]
DTTATGENARPSAWSFSSGSPHNQEEDIDANVVDMTDAKDTYEVEEQAKRRVMAENSKRKTDMLEQKLVVSSTLAVAKSEALLKKTDTTNLKECLKIMQVLDIDGVQFTKGLDHLKVDVVCQELFLIMNDQRRTDWLKASTNI